MCGAQMLTSDRVDVYNDASVMPWKCVYFGASYTSVTAGSVTVIDDAGSVTVTAEQVASGADGGATVAVVKVVGALELEAPCPVQVPNSFWHLFATAQ